MSRYPQRQRKPPLQDFQSIHHERAYVTGIPLPDEEEKKGFRNDALDKVWDVCRYIVLLQGDELQIEKKATAANISNNSNQEVSLLLGVIQSARKLWVITDTLKIFNKGNIPIMDLFLSTVKAKHPNFITNWTDYEYGANTDFYNVISVAGMEAVHELMLDKPGEDIELFEEIVLKLKMLEKELNPPKLGTRENPIRLTRP
jgi:hypothetical protein